MATNNGTSGNDTIVGNGEADLFNGGAGDDSLVGNDGNDSLRGSTGNDTLEGGSGEDFLIGDGGIDVIHGGADNDTIVVGTQPELGEVYDGGTGVDTLVIGLNDPVSDPDGTTHFYTFMTGNQDGPVTINSIEQIQFSSDSELEGARSSFVITAFQIGGDGISNTATLLGSGGVIDNSIHIVTGGAAGTYTLPSFIRGDGWNSSANVLDPGDTVMLFSHGSNSFVLNASADHEGVEILLGAGGDDTLNGTDGLEILNGAAGDNVINAGGGDDLVVISQADPDAEGFHFGTYDGGLGIDTLRVLQSAANGEDDDSNEFVGLFGVSLTSFERLEIKSDHDSELIVAVGAFQIGDGLFESDATLVGGEGNSILLIVQTNAGDFSLDAYNFHYDANWNHSTDVSDIGDLIVLKAGSGDNYTLRTTDVHEGFEGVAGGEGDDLLIGGSSQDYFLTGGGRDTIQAGDGDDGIELDGAIEEGLSIDGGAGTDSIEVGHESGSIPFALPLFNGPTSIVRLDDAELNSIERLEIDSDDNHNVIVFLDYDQIGSGISSNALLAGGEGRDTVTVQVSGGGEFITPLFTRGEDWDNSTDVFNPGDVVSLVASDDEDYILESQEHLGIDVLLGGDGNDTLFGSDGVEILNGGGGVNELYAGGGEDLLVVSNQYVISPSNQTSYTFEGSIFNGGTGTDYLSVIGEVDFAGTLISIEGFNLVEAFAPELPGTPGQLAADLTISSETLTALGDNLVFRGTGEVSINLSPSTSYFYGGDYSFAEGSNVKFEIEGTEFNDFIIGTSADDEIEGGTGYDYLEGGEGNDTIDGGGHEPGIFDFATYYWANSGVTVSLVLQGEAQDTGGAGIDTLISISGLSGSNHSDSLTGDSERNFLQDVSGGDDTLAGGAGDDEIYVGRYLDTPHSTVSLSGGDGNDSVGYSLFVSDGDEEEDVSFDPIGRATIDGGAGDDYLYASGLAEGTLTGGSGDDVVEVDGFGGTYEVTLGSGTDDLQLAFDNGGPELATIIVTDFVAGNDGDQVDIRDFDDVLFGVDGEEDEFNAFATGQARLLQDGGDTLLQINRDGVGNDFETLVTFENTLATSFTAYNFHGVSPTGIDEEPTEPTTGDDVLIGTSHNDVIDGLAGNDSISGLGGEDSLRGGAGNDTLLGGAGNDTLQGGQGNDVLIGGAGNDVYEVVEAGDTIIEGVDGGYDLVLTNGNYTLGDNVDDLSLTGAASVSGTGNEIQNYIYGSLGNNTLIGLGGDDYLDGDAGNDSLVGGEGADTLVGSGGNDTMVGGAGDDEYSVDAVGDRVVETADNGFDTVNSSINYTLDANVEFLVLHGSGNLTGVGNGLDNIITGNSGNNTLQGLAGIDTLFGEDGNDSVDGGAGADFVLGGNGNDSLMGGDGEDILVGGNGIDTLDGGRGADQMIGGNGDDTYVVDDAGDTVIDIDGGGIDTVRSSITYALGSNIENLILTGSLAIGGGGNTLDNAITGNSGANSLSGGAGADTLNGGDGNDTLDGGAGNDRMEGGAGNDTYRVDIVEGAFDDEVIEGASAGTDTVIFTSSFENSGYTLGANVENLIVDSEGGVFANGNALNNSMTSGAGSDQLLGGAGNDTLIGGAGNDTLVGGDGADRLEGGAGNDSYSIDAGDTVVESADNGTDSVTITGNYTLGANLEVLGILGSGNFTGTGNELNNLIAGNVGNNTLIGLAGNDTLDGDEGNDSLDGGAGTDYLVGGNGSDSVLGGEGDDTIFGGNGSDSLLGNAGDDILIGGNGSDTLDGGAGADTLEGGAGDDVYILSDFNDAITEDSDGGIDTVMTAVTHTLGANFENLVLTGGAGIGGGGNTLDNVITGNSGNNSITGGAGADTLIGNGGNDILDGGAGIDRMEGGAGDDTYILDNASDVVVEAAGGGNDTVVASRNYTLAANLENLTLVGDFNGVGNELANLITGSGDGNDLQGLAGNDTLVGNGGNDVMDGGLGADRMEGGAGNDHYFVDNVGDVLIEGADGGMDGLQTTVSYTLGDNFEYISVDFEAGAGVTITGNSLDNLMYGNDLGNTLNGAIGADYMFGGNGNDTYVVDNIGDVVEEIEGGGFDTVQSSIGYTLGDYLENLTLTGNANLSGTGNSLANLITGNGGANSLSGGIGDDTLIGAAGNDTLVGGAGVDRMEGGTGDDRYVVDNVGDVIVEAAASGTDTVVASSTYTLGVNLENLVLGGDDAIDGTGNTLNNVITGNDSANALNGGAGADTMVGGNGSDSYVVDNVGDVIIEDSSHGTDSVTASVTYTLGDNVENLTLGGVAAINGTGNAGANRITGNSANNLLAGALGSDTLVGNAGNDTLDGGGGTDQLEGGAGNDSYIVDNVDDVLVEALDEGIDAVSASVSYTLGDNVENLTLSGSGNIDGVGNSLTNAITGNAGNNALTGGAGNDTLIGNAGNDMLDGGLGNDRMEGGQGNDTYVVDSTTDVIVEAANAGTDTVETSATYTLGANIENLTLTGGANINGTGNTANNFITGNNGNNLLSGLTGSDTLFGGAGDDTLDGGAGVDSMRGGNGNDTYVVDNVGDVIVELEDEGIDTVSASSSYTLGANLENLILAGTAAINGTGNALANVITGNGGNNALAGLADDDTLVAGAGNDTLDGGTGVDSLVGGAGNDSYIVDDVEDVVVEALNEGADTVSASISYELGDNVENLTLTGDGNINGVGNGLNNAITGNAGNNALTGGAGNDTLIGNAGNDTLDGGLGNDRTEGGIGDDIYFVDATADIVVEAANAGTDTVQTSATYTLGANIENLTLTGGASINGTGNAANNLLSGNSGNNLLSGLVGNDTLSGGEGDDTLDGGAGVDSLSGGNGDDRYIVDNAGDVVVEADEEGFDTVSASVTYTLGDNVEGLVLTGSSAIGGTGNDGDNLLTGNGGANTLSGLDGADTLDGGAGNDSLLGGEGEDSLIGGAGNDTLDGGEGEDIMAGGVGNDSYVVDDEDDTVVELVGGGTDTVLSSVDYELNDNVENLTLTGSANNDGYGNGLANIIVGTSGDNELRGDAGNDTLRGGNGVDRLDGGVGNDRMEGGSGNDTYVVDVTGDVVVELAGLDNGIDTVESSITYTLGANVENLELTGTANVNGTGNTLNNVLIGNDGNNALAGGDGADALFDGMGNDTLNGGTGADLMAGGEGNDIYVVDNVGDIVAEAEDEGIDTVQSSISYELHDSVENLTLTGTTAINGTGNDQGNVITGNSGANTLSGGEGGDTLDGGAGNDTLDGGDDNDVLLGGAGNDALDGGAGSDTMTGGAGNDSYVVDDADDVVTEATGGGTDTVQSSLDYTLTANVENLTLTGGGNIDGAGNALANIVTGNGGDNSLSGDAGNDTLRGGNGEDTLDGGAGNDRLEGGDGDDIYFVDAGDTVVELSGAGHDTVVTGVTHTLAANVEDLTLNGSGNVNGTGNALDNSITGNSGNNALNGAVGDDTLDGGAGNDTLNGGVDADEMIGGLGNDSYVVDDAGDVVTEEEGEGLDSVTSSVDYALTDHVENLTLTGTAVEGTGNDANNVITGNAAANVLAGNEGADTLNGGAGNDTLDGGEGADSLVGGAGNDRYIVDDAGDVVVEANNAGIDTVEASVDHTLTANVENLTLSDGEDIDGTGNTLNNVITGNNGDNHLSGLAGNDTLSGGGGADTLDGGVGNDSMVGGEGDDVYIVDVVGDRVTETFDGGADEVRSSISYTLGSDVEHLTLTGSANLNGTGNTADNTLTGNSGNNVLTGNDGDDTLDGLAGADTLAGGNGNDMLDGGLGVDRMVGGAGDDLYRVDQAGDVVVEAANEGSDTVAAVIDYVLGDNVENLLLTGNEDIDGTGNGGNNLLYGNNGDNALSGGGGDDTIDGGLGADTITGGQGSDSFEFSSELGDGNVDTIVNFEAQDVFRLDAIIFQALTSGALEEDAFSVGAGATTSNQRIIYNDEDGSLYYDADGDGAGQAVQFANLMTPMGLLSFSNFMIYGGFGGGDMS